ncbi:hypothetical protein CC85DRAFT_258655 [Cutaneotrichosporon oleaginosum]|uniref:Peptidase A22B, signal peptide peptidase n=1 Tax=Cutaneotrichosporon oleaginosum TaxID=879819 RepID=A0A0J1B6S9_9TREE|nr:uncharacterized protein CC85DRAFT_258655 [Cutaneotrichosporon oleaginosum]KLT43419.1 hypothetical protein CC85DRAFT_258655 [Cutaneotrichosporon oleaginosum]TXT05367.1 hypothetical protein COLE_06687 [Cutaneotrichosporon oleaginosum]
MSEHLASFATLGAQALVPIFIGSFQSLRIPAPVRARKRAARRARVKLGDDEDDDILDENEGEMLTLADSVLFPILGSCALLGMWALITYVDRRILDLLLGCYFSFASVLAVQSTFDGVLNFLLRVIGAPGPTYHLRVSSGIKQIAHMPFRRASLIALPFAIGLPAAYIALGRPYLISNVLALCLASAALALLRLDGFPTAVLLLTLLLAYDVFWVFYTPVMVTVAKGIDAPMKLLAPKADKSFAMLGLGDVVIPGLLIALCLRFDLARHARLRPKEDVGPRSSFAKPYFSTAIASYICGLGATIAAMLHSGKAQPALLYLSPACIIGPLLTAAALGEVKECWTWRDEEEEEKDETIEAASEVAILARQEAKAKAAAAAATVDPDETSVSNGAAPDHSAPDSAAQDDSWMDGTGVAGAEGPRTRSKRKGGKRK